MAADMHQPKIPLVTYYDGKRLDRSLGDSAIPVLYAHAQCPYAQRAWMALIEKGVDHMFVQIDLSSKPSWFFSVNPKGLVPALQFKGEVIAESIDICQYSDSAWDGPPLMPDDPQQKQTTATLLDKTAEIVGVGLSCVGSDGSWAIAREQGTNQTKYMPLKQQLQDLETLIKAHGGPYLTGPTPTLADLALFPFFWRFLLVQKKVQSQAVGSIDCVESWLAKMSERHSGKVSNPDEALLLEAYRKHMRLDFFDYHSYPLESLHPHLHTD